MEEPKGFSIHGTFTDKLETQIAIGQLLSRELDVLEDGFLMKTFT